MLEKVTELKSGSFLGGRRKDRAKAVATVFNRPATVQIVLWGTLICVGLFLSLLKWNSFQLGTYNDDSSYIILARSILSADRYGLINHPGEPGTTQFPFGFPLLLAPYLLLFPSNPEGAKIISLAATLINAALLFWGWQKLTNRSSYWWAVAIVGLYLFSPFVVNHTGMVMSEPIFTTFCLLAILLAEQAAERKESAWWPIWSGVALVFVVYIRTIGITLLVGFFAYLLFRRGLAFWLKLAQVVASMAIILTLIIALTPINLIHLLPIRYFTSIDGELIRQFTGLESSNAQGPEAHFSYDGSLPEGESERGNFLNQVILPGFRRHLGNDLRETLVPFGEQRGQALANWVGIPWLMTLFGFLITGIILLGYLRLFKQRKVTLFSLYPIIYMVPLMAWSWHGSRLLYPVQPQFLFTFLLGIESLALGLISLSSIIPGRRSARQVTNRNPRRVAYGATLAVSGILLVTYVAASLDLSNSRLHVGDLQLRTQYLRTNLPSTEVVLTEAPIVDYFYGGHKTVAYPVSYQSVEEFERYLNQKQINAILVAPSIAWQVNYRPKYSPRAEKTLLFLDELEKQGKLALIYTSEEDLIKVYQIR